MWANVWNWEISIETDWIERMVAQIVDMPMQRVMWYEVKLKVAMKRRDEK
jgi:hypothetical protein